MSKKYSKRKIESLLLQTSATLSGEADKRIRGNLGIKDMTVPVMSAYGNDIQDTEYSEKSRDRESRIPVILTTSLTIAAVVCAVMLAVWARSLRKNQNNGGGAGQEGMTPTTVVTDTPAPEMSATPTLTTSPKVIEMPDYRGLDYSVAIAKLQALEMSLNITYEPAPESYEEYPVEGHVIKQLPDAGEPLREGDSVLLMYSIGDGLFEIGDYRGMTAEQVRYALDNKLDVRIDWVESDTVMENYVVDTQPGAGEKIPLGSTITVLLSRGNTKYTEVPNVIGKGEADAKALLVAAKLDYSTEWDYSDTVPAGTVISQSPDATAENVEKGTVVKLVISAGRESGSAPESTPTTAPTATPTTAPTATPTTAPTATPTTAPTATPTTAPTATPTTAPTATPTPEPTATPTSEPTATPTTTPASVENGEVKIDEAHFPDPLFRKFVSQNLDWDSNGVLDTSEIEFVESIRVDGAYDGPEEKKIKSLKGVEYFTELVSLSCSWNALTELDVSRNVKLVNLDCSVNQLGSLDLSHNPKLVTVDCRHNKIKSLDMSNNPELEVLHATESGCSSVNVTKCKKLQILSIEDCPIDDINLKNNPELTELYVDFTNITKLDVTNNKKLEILYCFENHKLDTILIDPATPLRALYCYADKLKVLDVSSYTKLERLVCDNNQLTSLDVSHNPELVQLSCYRNPINTLDVSNNTKLVNLSCADCGLSELDLSHNTELVQLNVIWNTSLNEIDVSMCPKLEDVLADLALNVIGAKAGVVRNY
ncbi:MAG: PASTA domain-containing protein [Lachnospiraceae bacterium]|nr:PASTA domain-containing protein [Lachnospiraceae bacterium]